MPSSQLSKVLNDLQSLTNEERRVVRRVLNQDHSLMTSYANLPPELMRQIFSHLDLGDMVTLTKVVNPQTSPFHAQEWNAYLMPHVHEVIHAQLRTLEPLAERFSFSASKRKEWRIKMLQEFQERQRGEFNLSILEYLPYKYKWDQTIPFHMHTSKRTIQWVEDGFCVFERTTHPSDSTPRRFMIPNRTELFVWNVSEKWLIAAVKGRRLHAWQLNDTDPSGQFNYKHFTTNLESHGSEDISISGDQVGIISATGSPRTINIWNITANSLTSLKAEESKDESGWHILLHPSDPTVFYISSRSDKCNYIRKYTNNEYSRKQWTYPTHLLGTRLNKPPFTRIHFASIFGFAFRPFVRVNFGGTYSFATNHQSTWLTFNVYQERIGVEHFGEYRGSEQFYLWEGQRVNRVVFRKMSRTLCEKFGIG